MDDGGNANQNIINYMYNILIQVYNNNHYRYSGRVSLKYYIKPVVVAIIIP